MSSFNKSRTTRRSTLGLEALEQRTLLAANLTASLGLDGILRVEGTENADTIRVRQVSGNLSVDGVHIKVGTANKASVAVTSVKAIEVRALGGHDTVDANTVNLGTTKTVTIYGGSGNDTIIGTAALDKIYGEAGNDILYGRAGNDSLYGGADNDSLFGEGGNDWLDGGPGYDILTDIRASMSNGERVKILLDDATINPQNDNVSCGPNSAARFLRNYGYNVSYEQLRSLGRRETSVGIGPIRLSLYDINMGTPPPELRDVIRQFKSDVTLKHGADFNSVLNLLGQGKPVIALIKTGEVRVLTESVPTLHYVVLTGYDQSSQTISYTDTNGASKTWTYSDFRAKWNWSDGGVTGPVLSAVGVRPRTILY